MCETYYKPESIIGLASGVSSKVYVEETLWPQTKIDAPMSLTKAICYLGPRRFLSGIIFRRILPQVAACTCASYCLMEMIVQR